MASLSGKTPASSYRDLLHLANGGNGVSADEHLPVCDGTGTPVGISLGAGQVSVDFSGGTLSNAVLTSRMSAAPYSEVSNSAVALVDMDSCSARIIRFTESTPSSVSISFSLPLPGGGVPAGMHLFAETRMIISAPIGLTIDLQDSVGSSFGSVTYDFNPALPYLHFRVCAIRSDAEPNDTVFFVSETSHFGG